MDARSSLSDIVPFSAPAETIGVLDIDVTARLLAETGDVTFILDHGGVIRDIAIASRELADEGFGEWRGRAWIDTVSDESRGKIGQMLRDAASAQSVRWRQVNHVTPAGEVPVRYLALSADADGRVIAVGRDVRATAALQQRLLAAQQSMERDYVRLRQAESRYRQLFDQSSEAVLIVDASTRRITDANPAAKRLVSGRKDSPAGQPFSSILHGDDRDAGVAMLGAVAATEKVLPLVLRMTDGRQTCEISATLFREGRGAYFLVRLRPLSNEGPGAAEGGRSLEATLELIPDAFVLTDETLTILAHNSAFLDITQYARPEQVVGQPLGQFVGRPGIDLNLLQSQLRDHGMVRNFSTIVRSQLGLQDEVELAAVATQDNDRVCYGLSLRDVGHLRPARMPVGDNPQSVEQLTELVGRVSLKEIVRESTSLIERLCIEAALNYTSDNRASAAELLGLSRQSLYSKLHRHGMATGGLAEDD
jgi:transcriptional regulator PpsR